MTPEQHANTVREHLHADYLGPDPNDMDGEKWGQHPEALAALQALVALAERADTLERERAGYLRDFLAARERAEAVETEAEQARAEADRLREAGRKLVNAHARRHPDATFWTLNERMALDEIADLAGTQTKETT